MYASGQALRWHAAEAGFLRGTMLSALLSRRACVSVRAMQPMTLPRVVSARGLATGSEPYDVVVIGGGPGGYVAASRRASWVCERPALRSVARWVVRA